MKGGIRGFLLAALVVMAGCGQEEVSRPADSPTNVIVAYYQTDEAIEEAPIALNGERIDREWGSEFTPDRPFTHVRLSADEGAGNPGSTRYISVKAVYTSRHLYLLLQWVDEDASNLKDIFVYTGPPLNERLGPQDSLVTPAWWERAGEDDKVALIFEMEPTAGDGLTFADNGCQALCHPGSAPAFGTSDSGRLDVWYWMAGRTNPVRNLFFLSDSDPNDPEHGDPGYLDDWYATPLAGLNADPGWPCYLRNDAAGQGYPEYVYRRRDDDFYDPPNPLSCENRFGADCVANNAVPFIYLWREYPNDYFAAFSAVDTLNQAIFPDAREWYPGDIAPGYMLTYPSDSRAHVRGKALHDEDLVTWTLEIGRRLDTGDPEHDVIFEPEPGREYPFTIAVFDASAGDHWGSEPQVLVFGERGDD